MHFFTMFSFYFLIISLVFLYMGLFFFMNNLFFMIEWELYSLNSLDIIFPLILDFKCWMFLGIVFLISSMVIFYSSNYMNGEKNSFRFLILVVLFIFSMMFLILSPCLVSILLGWDGLGLISYSLVIFYQSQSCSNSGMITALTNRIGDVLILLSIGLMTSLGSWNFLLVSWNGWNLSSIFCILVCMAAMTKSAQVPFSAWLPAAMAAPTPVSSLVHSSTLVTAGIYLLIRFNVFLSEEKMLCFFLSFLGSMTMLMSGLSANVQFDMKKIIALSTLSQLGVMFTSLSLGMEDLCFFHLLTHALFKSLLFMCAGSFIHSNSNNQDIRLFGDPKKFLPLTLVYFNTANLALCGMPFLSGFYSKDLILELISLSSMNFLIYFVFFFATGLTVSYTFRLIFFSVNFKFNYISPIVSMKDNSFNMLVSMSLLFFSSIFMGKFGSFLFLINPMNFIVLPNVLKFLTIGVCFLGLTSGLILSLSFSFKESYFFSISTYWLNKMWFMSSITPEFLKLGFLNLGGSLSKVSSSGWVEEFMGLGVLKEVFYFSFNLIYILSKIYFLMVLFFLFSGFFIFFNL
uniref:NADH-ubiquinone oxidoreductase chain 5 n=1 Tax=Aeolothrips indicus TaxID=2856552 RepID=A0A8F5PL27_9NEOP|nr:NADH dehydrogenase subunit 5 [Aeolothrips indicus]